MLLPIHDKTNGMQMFKVISINTVLVIIKLTVALRLRCGSCNIFFDIILSFFAKFKNVVHR